MIGIYHSKDFDGIASGAIMKHKYPYIKLIGYDHGDEFDFSIFNKDEEVYMADVSFDMNKMNEIAKNSKSFAWIDHHKSAINNYENYNKKFSDKLFVKLDSSRSACELIWDFFYNELPPLGIQFLGEYDTFITYSNKTRWYNLIMPFQLGMKSICTSVDDFPVALFTDDIDLIHDIIAKGKIIFNYYENNNKQICNSCAFEAKLCDYNAICINGFGLSSEIFKSKYDESKHDLMLVFCNIAGQTRVTLYSTKDNIDCSEIARSFGGGGHKGAAGFQVDNLPLIYK